MYSKNRELYFQIAHVQETMGKLKQYKQARFASLSTTQSHKKGKEVYTQEMYLLFCAHPGRR